MQLTPHTHAHTISHVCAQTSTTHTSSLFTKPCRTISERDPSSGNGGRSGGAP